MNEVMLSVITPSHNQDIDIFLQTADSVLNAVKDLDWEWIIVLHNNDTFTKEELMKVLPCDSRIRIFEKRDGIFSPSSPRNEGIRKSVGKYLYFVDDDDILYPDFLKEAVKKMERDNCDILIGNIDAKSENEDVFQVLVPLLFPETEDGYILPDDPLIRGNLLFGACNFLSSKVILGSLVRENHIFFNESFKMSEDILFEVNCYAKAGKICAMSSLTAYTYMQRKGSLLQKMLSDDSFDLKVYTEPMDTIVSRAMESNISPSGFIWLMMATSAVIYYNGAMDKKKKTQLYSHVQSYLRLANMDFPKQISDKILRKEYIVNHLIDEDLMKERINRLIEKYEIKVTDKRMSTVPLYYKNISSLKEKQQISFIRGFWNVLEKDAYSMDVGAFQISESKTMVLLNIEKKLSDKIGLHNLKRDLCYGER